MTNSVISRVKSVQNISCEDEEIKKPHLCPNDKHYLRKVIPALYQKQHGVSLTITQ
jgi:hypothetical protein